MNVSVFDRILKFLFKLTVECSTSSIVKFNLNHIYFLWIYVGGTLPFPLYDIIWSMLTPIVLFILYIFFNYI